MGKWLKSVTRLELLIMLKECDKNPNKQYADAKRRCIIQELIRREEEKENG